MNVNLETGEIVRPYIRKPWERHASRYTPVGESMTHQSHAETCDINRIVATYMNTGYLPDGNQNGQYGDVTELQGDFTEMVNQSWETQRTLKERIDHERKQKKAAADAQAAKDAADLAAYRSQLAGNVGATTPGSEAAPKATG